VERHLGVLAILMTLWGALAMLVGVSMLLEATGALAILFTPEAEFVGFAAGLTATAFAVLGVFSAMWGGAHLWAARRLRRHHASGRIMTLVLAIVNLLILPFGTALGIYAFWVLLTNDGRRLFEPPVPA
jgi:hypothetical protein